MDEVFVKQKSKSQEQVVRVGGEFHRNNCNRAWFVSLNRDGDISWGEQKRKNTKQGNRASPAPTAKRSKNRHV